MALTEILGYSCALASNCELRDVLATWVAVTGREGCDLTQAIVERHRGISQSMPDEEEDSNILALGKQHQGFDAVNYEKGLPSKRCSQVSVYW